MLLGLAAVRKDCRGLPAVVATVPTNGRETCI